MDQKENKVAAGDGSPLAQRIAPTHDGECNGKGAGALVGGHGMASNLKKRLAKKAKKGFRGYPVGTLAFYGPDDRRASKVVTSVVVASMPMYSSKNLVK